MPTLSVTLTPATCLPVSLTTRGILKHPESLLTARDENKRVLCVAWQNVRPYDVVALQYSRKLCNMRLCL